MFRHRDAARKVFVWFVVIAMVLTLVAGVVNVFGS